MLITPKGKRIRRKVFRLIEISKFITGYKRINGFVSIMIEKTEVVRDRKRIIQAILIKNLFLENLPRVKNPRNKKKEIIILNKCL